MESVTSIIFLLVLSIIFQGYFTMMEMAFVTFNRVRLAYYVNKESKRAIWLQSLLSEPAFMFGTTLIGVNFFLQLGSECSRLLFDKVGLNADYAYIMQLVLVLLFAELAPMFAGRAYPEHVAMLGITPIYFLSKVLRPIVWVLNFLCILLDKITRAPQVKAHMLSRDELKKAIESKDERTLKDETFLSTLMDNIFTLKGKLPSDLMLSIDKVTSVPSHLTAGEVKPLVRQKFTNYIPVYFEHSKQVFGILYTRDLIRIADDVPIREIARSPWFITEKNSIFQILKQFRWNNQGLAIVLNDQGSAVGILTLDRLIEEIFTGMLVNKEKNSRKSGIVVNKSFPAETRVEKVTSQLAIHLAHTVGTTLEQLMVDKLGHSPAKGEYVHVGEYELVLEEASLVNRKMVRVKSRELF